MSIISPGTITVILPFSDLLINSTITSSMVLDTVPNIPNINKQDTLVAVGESNTSIFDTDKIDELSTPTWR